MTKLFVVAPLNVMARFLAPLDGFSRYHNSVLSHSVSVVGLQSLPE